VRRYYSKSPFRYVLMLVSRDILLIQILLKRFLKGPYNAIFIQVNLIL